MQSRSRATARAGPSCGPLPSSPTKQRAAQFPHPLSPVFLLSAVSLSLSLSLPNVLYVQPLLIVRSLTRSLLTVLTATKSLLTVISPSALFCAVSPTVLVPPGLFALYGRKSCPSLCHLSVSKLWQLSNAGPLFSPERT